MNGLKNLALLGVSCIFSILAAEAISRVFLNPIDYLKVEPVADRILNHKIASHAGGHDLWGFRNPAVPQQTDILAIGDSMTYGVMATSTTNWPSQLGKLTGRSVYNAALGGYGPLHYLHLLRSKAPLLSPNKIIIAIYIGNDLMDAYNLAYSNDNWKKYRNYKNKDIIDRNLFIAKPSNKKFLADLREWLAQSSVLYRLISQNRIFDNFRRKQGLNLSPSSFQVKFRDQPVVLDPAKQLRFVDSNDPRIVEAIEITERAIREIKEFCAKHAIQLQVVIVPVKEEVYITKILSNLAKRQKSEISILQENLNNVRSKIEEILINEKIDYIDLKNAMESKLNSEYIYPVADGHPNSTGYSVIAERIAESMNDGLK